MLPEQSLVEKALGNLTGTQAGGLTTSLQNIQVYLLVVLGIMSVTLVLAIMRLLRKRNR